MTLQEEWDRTEIHIDWLKKQFVALHNKPQKDWDETYHSLARQYRSGAIFTGEWRYWILQRARKEGIKIV
jgi:hypothetical protein